jgi:hypothetical protein
MEGMVFKGMRNIQEIYALVEGSNITSTQWAQGLIIKLLEVTHGQWLYRCVQIHDRVSGTRITARKEEIQSAIEAQQEMGTEDLLEEDQYLVEVHLEDLESTSGERQEYWLIAIRAARQVSILQRDRQSNVRRRNLNIRGQMHR